MVPETLYSIGAVLTRTIGARPFTRTISPNLAGSARAETSTVRATIPTGMSRRPSRTFFVLTSPGFTGSIQLYVKLVPICDGMALHGQ